MIQQFPVIGVGGYPGAFLPGFREALRVGVAPGHRFRELRLVVGQPPDVSDAKLLHCLKPQKIRAVREMPFRGELIADNLIKSFASVNSLFYFFFGFFISIFQFSPSRDGKAARVSNEHGSGVPWLQAQGVVPRSM